MVDIFRVVAIDRLEHLKVGTEDIIMAAQEPILFSPEPSLCKWKVNEVLTGKSFNFLKVKMDIVDAFHVLLQDLRFLSEQLQDLLFGFDPCSQLAIRSTEILFVGVYVFLLGILGEDGGAVDHLVGSGAGNGSAVRASILLFGLEYWLGRLWSRRFLRRRGWFRK